MDKRVLLPTDFSKNALNAIRYALDLYKDVRVEFYLLNVFSTSGFYLERMMVPEPGEKMYEAAKSESDKGMERLMEMIRLHPDNPKHAYHTLSVFGSLLGVIKDTIAQKDIDLVIMGTKGATGSDAAIFGTNTVKIMEKVRECPVMAIPDDYSFSPPKDIVFPTDYKSGFKRRELIYLLEIAKLHKAVIHILHIEKESKLNTTQQNNKVLLENIFGECEYQNHSMAHVKVHAGIYAFLESRKSDMIAFVNKKHLFFGSILSNPLVKEIGYEATIPVLVLNDNS